MISENACERSAGRNHRSVETLVRLDRASHPQAFTGSTGGMICVAEGSWWRRSVAQMEQTRDGANALGRSWDVRRRRVSR